MYGFFLTKSNFLNKMRGNNAAPSQLTTLKSNTYENKNFLKFFSWLCPKGEFGVMACPDPGGEIRIKFYTR